MLTTVQLEKIGVTELVFQLTGDIFSMSYCGYGNLLCHKIDSNVFTNDWAVFWYLGFGFNRYRVLKMIR